MYPRLNYVRLFLAWSVLAFHSNFLMVPLAGMLAVWCFFFISGFLVSNILYDCYQGRYADFIVNRFLRIFPTYWAALAIGFTLTAIDPEGLAAFDHSIYMPETFDQWVSNLFIFGLPTNSVIVPPAWSLAVELNWYLILFVGSMLSLRWLIIFLSANLILPFTIMYFSTEAIYIHGTGFAFALGAMAYHTRLIPPKWLQVSALISLPLLMFVIPFYAELSAFKSNDPRVNYSLLGTVVLLYVAFPWLVKEGKVSTWSKLAGELSYPLFLVHIFAIYVSIWLFDVPRVGWQTLAATTVISLLASLLIVKLVENPVAIVRARIRGRDRKINKLTDEPV